MKSVSKTLILRFLLVIMIAFSLVLLAKNLGFISKNRKPNILLITSRALRPDHLSCYGYNHINTGSIDELAMKGVVFENSYGSVPHFLYSFSSIFSGNTGSSSVLRRGDTLTVNKPQNLLRTLKENGYYTAAITTSPPLSRGLGLETEFDLFKNIFADPSGTKNISPVPPGEITDEVLNILEENTRAKKPVFLWLELSIPLAPYKIPESFLIAQYDHPYDRQILLLNEEISKLNRGMRDLGLDKNTVIIFTAANGESLGEHQEVTHGLFLYNSVMKTPLIIKFPRNIYAGKRVSSPVAQVDIAPTIMEIIGAEQAQVPQDMEGRTLMPLIKGDDVKDLNDVIYLETMNGYHDFGWSPSAAIVTDDHKYIELPIPELYDLKNDPYELINIVDTSPEKAEELKKKLFEYVEKNRPGFADILSKGADPKDMFKFIKPIRLKNSNAGTLIRLYKERLYGNPGNKLFRYLLAEAYYRIGRIEDAEKIVSYLTEVYPDMNRAWELLGFVYDNQNKLDEAIRCYENAIEIFPDMPFSLNNLAWHYSEKGIKLDDALKYAMKANQLIPDNPNFLDTLSNVYLKMGNNEKAKEISDRAASLTQQLQAPKETTSE